MQKVQTHHSDTKNHPCFKETDDDSKAERERWGLHVSAQTDMSYRAEQ